MGLPEPGCLVGEPPPFSRLDEVVTKAAREGCLMLVGAPEWSAPGYPWRTALCALCHRRWCFPEGRPVNLRGGHGHGASPAVEDMGLPRGLPLTLAAGSTRTTAWRAVWRGPDGPPHPTAGGTSSP